MSENKAKQKKQNNKKECIFLRYWVFILILLIPLDVWGYYPYYPGGVSMGAGACPSHPRGPGRDRETSDDVQDDCDEINDNLAEERNIIEEGLSIDFDHGFTKEGCEYEQTLDDILQRNRICCNPPDGPSGRSSGDGIFGQVPSISEIFPALADLFIPPTFADTQVTPPTGDAPFAGVNSAKCQTCINTTCPQQREDHFDCQNWCMNNNSDCSTPPAPPPPVVAPPLPEPAPPPPVVAPPLPEPAPPPPVVAPPLPEPAPPPPVVAPPLPEPAPPPPVVAPPLPEPAPPPPVVAPPLPEPAPPPPVVAPPLPEPAPEEEVKKSFTLPPNCQQCISQCQTDSSKSQQECQTGTCRELCVIENPIGGSTAGPPPPPNCMSCRCRLIGTPFEGTMSDACRQLCDRNPDCKKPCPPCEATETANCPTNQCPCAEETRECTGGTSGTVCPIERPETPPRTPGTCPERNVPPPEPPNCKTLTVSEICRGLKAKGWIQRDSEFYEDCEDTLREYERLKREDRLCKNRVGELRRRERTRERTTRRRGRGQRTYRENPNRDGYYHCVDCHQSSHGKGFWAKLIAAGLIDGGLAYFGHKQHSRASAFARTINQPAPPYPVPSFGLTAGVLYGSMFAGSGFGCAAGYPGFGGMYRMGPHGMINPYGMPAMPYGYPGLGMRGGLHGAFGMPGFGMPFGNPGFSPLYGGLHGGFGMGGGSPYGIGSPFGNPFGGGLHGGFSMGGGSPYGIGSPFGNPFGGGLHGGFSMGGGSPYGIGSPFGNPFGGGLHGGFGMGGGGFPYGMGSPFGGFGGGGLGMAGAPGMYPGGLGGGYGAMQMQMEYHQRLMDMQREMQANQMARQQTAYSIQMEIQELTRKLYQVQYGGGSLYSPGAVGRGPRGSGGYNRRGRGGQRGGYNRGGGYNRQRGGYNQRGGSYQRGRQGGSYQRRGSSRGRVRQGQGGRRR